MIKSRVMAGQAMGAGVDGGRVMGRMKFNWEAFWREIKQCQMYGKI